MIAMLCCCMYGFQSIDRKKTQIHKNFTSSLCFLKNSQANFIFLSVICINVRVKSYDNIVYKQNARLNIDFENRECNGIEQIQSETNKV